MRFSALLLSFLLVSCGEVDQIEKNSKLFQLSQGSSEDSGSDEESIDCKLSHTNVDQWIQLKPHAVFYKNADSTNDNERVTAEIFPIYQAKVKHNISCDQTDSYRFEIVPPFTLDNKIRTKLFVSAKFIQATFEGGMTLPRDVSLNVDIPDMENPVTVPSQEESSQIDVMHSESTCETFHKFLSVKESAPKWIQNTLLKIENFLCQISHYLKAPKHIIELHEDHSKFCDSVLEIIKADDNAPEWVKTAISSIDALLCNISELFADYHHEDEENETPEIDSTRAEEIFIVIEKAYSNDTANQHKLDISITNNDEHPIPFSLDIESSLEVLLNIPWKKYTDTSSGDYIELLQLLESQENQTEDPTPATTQSHIPEIEVEEELPETVTPNSENSNHNDEIIDINFDDNEFSADAQRQLHEISKTILSSENRNDDEQYQALSLLTQAVLSLMNVREKQIDNKMYIVDPQTFHREKITSFIERLDELLQPQFPYDGIIFEKLPSDIVSAIAWSETFANHFISQGSKRVPNINSSGASGIMQIMIGSAWSWCDPNEIFKQVVPNVSSDILVTPKASCENVIQDPYMNILGGFAIFLRSLQGSASLESNSNALALTAGYNQYAGTPGEFIEYERFETALTWGEGVFLCEFVKQQGQIGNAPDCALLQ